MGADIGNDHNLIIMQSELKYKMLAKTKVKYIQTDKLTGKDIKKEYKLLDGT